MLDRIEDLERRLAEMERRIYEINRRSRRRLAAAALAAGLAVAWATMPEARAQFGLTLVGLNARLTAVEAKTAPLSVAGSTLTITGVNVQIVDGTGSNNSASGLGNLTVGYNALRGNNGQDARTGSHNLILGDENNYTSSGGLVAGIFNTISGLYATVSGGVSNTASATGASVSGGAVNTASEQDASVSGGIFNTASGVSASVSGGEANTASGGYASVSGGSGRSAPNQTEWVAGGLSQPQ